MTDYRAVVDELRNGNSIPLYEALRDDICPSLWKQKADLLEGSEIGGEFEDFVLWCYELVLRPKEFLRHLLSTSAPPGPYLRVALEHAINAHLRPVDKRFYYHARLEKLLTSHSSYRMVRPQVFALPEYADCPVYSGDPSDLERYLARSLPALSALPVQINMEEIARFVNELLRKAESPVHLRVMWPLFMNHFNIKPLKVQSLDLYMEYLPSAAGPPNEDIDAILAGEATLEESDLVTMAREFFTSLPPKERMSLHCFALELFRALDADMPDFMKLEWESIRACMNVRSDQTARNQIYKSGNSILGRYAHTLGRNDYFGEDFILAVRLLGKHSLHVERSAA